MMRVSVGRSKLKYLAVLFIIVPLIPLIGLAVVNNYYYVPMVALNMDSIAIAYYLYLFVPVISVLIRELEAICQNSSNFVQSQKLVSIGNSLFLLKVERASFIIVATFWILQNSIEGKLSPFLSLPELTLIIQVCGRLCCTSQLISSALIQSLFTSSVCLCCFLS